MVTMANNELTRVRELLTGYVNKTLSSDDQAFMDQWMNDPDRAQPDVLDEQRWLALTRAQLRDAVPKPAPDAGWHELLARIEVEPIVTPSRGAQAPEDQGLAAWFWRLWRQPALAYAVLVLLVGQMAVLAWQWSPHGEVRLMSAPTVVHAPVASVLVQVAWRAHATSAQMQSVLQQVQGTVVSGPSVLGLWLVAVPQAQADEALKTLRSSAAVEQASRAP
jgi:hypothetical protein